MAYLVIAAHILEIISQRALGSNPPAASAWCESFSYKLKHLLLSLVDGSFFGAVFIWSYVSVIRHFQLHRPSVFPANVIVFRAEWNRYLLGLQRNGFQLSGSEDTLVLFWNE